MNMEMTLLATMAVGLVLLVAFHALLHATLEKVEVAEYQAGLLYRQGRFVRTLGPGVYHLVKPWLRERVNALDMRLVSIAVPPQEVLTKDALPVRLTLIAQYKIGDPVKAAHVAGHPAGVLYEDLQLVLRELVAEKTLEEVLADKSAMGDALTARVRGRAETYGATLLRAGVKDIVLPGGLKVLLQSLEEAKQGARAELERARAELAATRVRLNTAKLYREHPELMRLRELEMMGRAAVLKLKVEPRK